MTIGFNNTINKNENSTPLTPKILDARECSNEPEFIEYIKNVKLTEKTCLEILDKVKRTVNEIQEIISPEFSPLMRNLFETSWGIGQQKADIKIHCLAIDLLLSLQRHIPQLRETINFFCFKDVSNPNSPTNRIPVSNTTLEPLLISCVRLQKLSINISPKGLNLDCPYKTLKNLIQNESDLLNFLFKTTPETFQEKLEVFVLAYNFELNSVVKKYKNLLLSDVFSRPYKYQHIGNDLIQLIEVSIKKNDRAFQGDIFLSIAEKLLTGCGIMNISVERINKELSKKIYTPDDIAILKEFFYLLTDNDKFLEINKITNSETKLKNITESSVIYFRFIQNCTYMKAASYKSPNFLSKLNYYHEFYISKGEYKNSFIFLSLIISYKIKLNSLSVEENKKYISEITSRSPSIPELSNLELKTLLFLQAPQELLNSVTEELNKRGHPYINHISLENDFIIQDYYGILQKISNLESKTDILESYPLYKLVIAEALASIGDYSQAQETVKNISNPNYHHSQIVCFQVYLFLINEEWEKAYNLLNEAESISQFNSKEDYYSKILHDFFILVKSKMKLYQIGDHDHIYPVEGQLTQDLQKIYFIKEQATKDLRPLYPTLIKILASNFVPNMKDYINEWSCKFFIPLNPLKLKKENPEVVDYISNIIQFSRLYSNSFKLYLKAKSKVENAKYFQDDLLVVFPSMTSKNKKFEITLSLQSIENIYKNKSLVEIHLNRIFEKLKDSDWILDPKTELGFLTVNDFARFGILYVLKKPLELLNKTKNNKKTPERDLINDILNETISLRPNVSKTIQSYKDLCSKLNIESKDKELLLSFISILSTSEVSFNLQDYLTVKTSSQPTEETLKKLLEVYNYTAEHIYKQVSSFQERNKHYDANFGKKNNSDSLHLMAWTNVLNSCYDWVPMLFQDKKISGQELLLHTSDLLKNIDFTINRTNNSIFYRWNLAYLTNAYLEKVCMVYEKNISEKAKSYQCLIFMIEALENLFLSNHHSPQLQNTTSEVVAIVHFPVTSFEFLNYNQILNQHYANLTQKKLKIKTKNEDSLKDAVTYEQIKPYQSLLFDFYNFIYTLSTEIEGFTPNHFKLILDTYILFNDFLKTEQSEFNIIKFINKTNMFVLFYTEVLNKAKAKFQSLLSEEQPSQVSNFPSNQDNNLYDSHFEQIQKELLCVQTLMYSLAFSRNSIAYCLKNINQGQQQLKEREDSYEWLKDNEILNRKKVRKTNSKNTPSTTSTNSSTAALTDCVTEVLVEEKSKENNSQEADSSDSDKELVSASEPKSKEPVLQTEPAPAPEIKKSTELKVNSTIKSEKNATQKSNEKILYTSLIPLLSDKVLTKPKWKPPIKCSKKVSINDFETIFQYDQIYHLDHLSWSLEMLQELKSDEVLSSYPFLISTMLNHLYLILEQNLSNEYLKLLDTNNLFHGLIGLNNHLSSKSELDTKELLPALDKYTYWYRYPHQHAPNVYKKDGKIPFGYQYVALNEGNLQHLQNVHHFPNMDNKNVNKALQTLILQSTHFLMDQIKKNQTAQNPELHSQLDSLYKKFVETISQFNFQTTGCKRTQHTNSKISEILTAYQQLFEKTSKNDKHNVLDILADLGVHLHRLDQSVKLIKRIPGEEYESFHQRNILIALQYSWELIGQTLAVIEKEKINSHLLYNYYFLFSKHNLLTDEFSDILEKFNLTKLADYPYWETIKNTQEKEREPLPVHHTISQAYERSKSASLKKMRTMVSKKRESIELNTLNKLIIGQSKYMLKAINVIAALMKS